MKLPIRFLSLIFVLLSFIACQSADNAATNSTAAEPPQSAKTAVYKRYGVESGIVELAVSGAQKGTETIYFDRWGQREATYTNAEISFAGISQKQNTLNLLEGETIYNINLDTRTGTKTVNPMLKKILADSPDRDLGEVGMRMLKDMGGVKIGTEEVAGKLCEVWEVKNLQSKSWVWKAVTLKVQVKMAGMDVTKIATRFEEGAAIPNDKLAIPPDVKITEGVDLKSIRERMKKPGAN